MMDWVRLLEKRIDDALAAGDYDRALSILQSTTEDAFYVSREKRLLNFGDPVLDRLCQRIGDQFVSESENLAFSDHDSSGNTDIYVASEVYAHGGHTPLIGDLVAAAKRPSVLLITNPFNRKFDLENLKHRIGIESDRVLVSNAESPAMRLCWLIENIKRRAPGRVFLLNHPQDSVAVAAIHPRVANRFYFVHIVDRNPGLGTFHSGATHIDLSPFCFHTCRQRLGIAASVYLPLVAPDLGVRPPYLDLGHRLTTASSGSENKFPTNYRYSYPSVLGTLLAATGGRHVHIGKLPKDYLADIASALASKAVPADRFVYIPHVTSLWSAMLEYGVDLYMGSFPIGGARASVEVMGSGTPAVWHVEKVSTRFHDTHMKYPEAAVWFTPDELVQVARSADCSWKNAMRKSARARYESLHHPDQLAGRIAALPDSAGGSQPVSDVALGEPAYVEFGELL